MIEEHVNLKFPGESDHAKAYRDELIRVCRSYRDSDYSDRNFADEITSGEDSKFWSRLSEALIFDRLQGKSHDKREVGGAGPDFLLMNGEQSIWVEVICPEPSGLPEEWLNPPDGAYNFPHEAILLRWTAAIKEKAEKLIGNDEKSTPGYLANGIVRENDAYVIAVNCCQLGRGHGSTLTGISQFPFAVEAVFPVGPIQLALDRRNGEVLDRGHQHRPYIINRNQAQVPAGTFLDSRFNSVSAIWAVEYDGSSVCGNSERSAVVHNPNATNPIPLGYFPADSEYAVTERTDEMYVLQKVQ